MRDAINPTEYDRLVGAARAGKSWDEIRGMLPGVDPGALDLGFKAQVMRAAGVEEPAPEPVPEVMAQLVERAQEPPKARKKG